jgi:uncharacterized protein (DUF3084 family)
MDGEKSGFSLLRRFHREEHRTEKDQDMLLEMLKSSSVLKDFVAQHHGYWNSQDWQQLLEKLRSLGYGGLNLDSIGKLLEEEKKVYLQNPKPEAQEPKEEWKLEQDMEKVERLLMEEKKLEQIKPPQGTDLSKLVPYEHVVQKKIQDLSLAISLLEKNKQILDVKEIEVYDTIKDIKRHKQIIEKEQGELKKKISDMEYKELKLMEATDKVKQREVELMQKEQELGELDKYLKEKADFLVNKEKQILERVNRLKEEIKNISL